MEIIELRGDSQAGASLIEQNLHTSGACVATPLVRTLLAEAYLLEAAKIAAKPTAKNARLVREAKDAMGGDLTDLARRAAERPGLLDPIVPFFKGSVATRGQDSDELTIVCKAIRAINPVMVEEELGNGADPNGKCDGDSLVRRLLLTATHEHVAQRQSILRSLLEHGARVEGLDSCASVTTPTCGEAPLLPILQEFEQKRAKSRTTL